MFDIDLLIAFAFMTLLFLRQISILKQPNKINYAPLMIGIGSISSVIHFILHPDTADVILLLRESLIPLLVALLLYIVMNIMHQTQESQNARSKDEFSKVLVSEISGLKVFMSELESRMNNSQQEDLKVQEEVRRKFQDDIKALDAIRENQTKFLSKFDEMDSWHKNVSKEFEHFTEVQMPELDNVVHKHIDILRVAEQDHYNQLKSTLSKAVDSRLDITDDLEELKKNLESMKNVSDDIAKAITKHTLQQLSGVTKAFENQIVALKSHAESVKTSLHEGDSTLNNIRTQSEMIMKQMSLSANKMDELEKQNDGLHDIYSAAKELMGEIEMIKADYVKSQSQLAQISHEISVSKDEQIDSMKNQIDLLGKELTQKIDSSLEKLHEHYHIADEDITQSVQMLSKKAQLKSGYTELDS
ncbi:MAG: hypothetical protein U9Q40_11485 [Campylobacterota bacterium]|nr:hypothetical protein [Campylobacterota bacterium]